MKCLACQKEIRVKVSWQNLFREKSYFICDKCYIKYPLDISYQVFPFFQNVHVFSLFNKKYDVNTYAFLDETTGLLSFIMNKFDLNKNLCFFFDNVEQLLEYEDKLNSLKDFQCEIIAIVTFL